MVTFETFTFSCAMETSEFLTGSSSFSRPAASPPVVPISATAG
jgi:hypothetical protein